jgi:hypothetical protein
MQGRQGKSWALLIGWLTFVCAWLVAGLAPTMQGAWRWQSVSLLLLTSLCWGIYGWQHVAQTQPESSREVRAFIAALGALLPWLGFLAFLIIPYALGVRR